MLTFLGGEATFIQGGTSIPESRVYVKMTQINFVSRNLLQSTANSCQHLNFGLSWPG